MQVVSAGRRGSLGHVTVMGLVYTMKPLEIRRENRALQSMAHALDVYSNPSLCVSNSEAGIGVTVPDLVKPDETLIVYADANAKAGYRMTNCTTSVLVDHFKAARILSESRRFRRRVELAFELYPKRGEPARGADRQLELAVMQAVLVEFAALVISQAALAEIVSVADGVPVLLIAGRTTSRGGRAVTTRFHASRLPGRWLGTTPAVGHA